jgi:hypothetical protein
VTVYLRHLSVELILAAEQGSIALIEVTARRRPRRPRAADRDGGIFASGSRN